MTYEVTFTALARKAAGDALAALEAHARREVGIHVLWFNVPGCEMDELPSWGFTASNLRASRTSPRLRPAIPWRLMSRRSRRVSSLKPTN